MTGTTNTTSWCGEHCFQLTIVMVMLSIFSTFGVVGNSLVIYVFGRRKEKLTSTMFILALAVTDLIACLVIMPFTIAGEALQYQFEYDFICKMYNFSITFAIPLSCFIMVAIAVDRYCCICHPFAHAINVPRAKAILVVIALFASLLGLLTSLTVGTYKYEGGCTDTSVNITSVNSSNISHSIRPRLNLTECRNMKNPEDFIEAVVYTGLCTANDIIFSFQFKYVYQKVYASFFLISVIIVLVLYSLIYHSVRTRRALREQQRGLVVTRATTQHAENSCMETQMTVLNGHEEDKDGKDGDDKRASKKERKRTVRRDKNKVANLKTAFMLFVVTIVFTIVFTPSWMIAQHVLPTNLVVFYFYFIYNVINPVIYAFLNKSFRDDLAQIFRCKR